MQVNPAPNQVKALLEVEIQLTQCIFSMKAESTIQGHGRSYHRIDDNGEVTIGYKFSESSVETSCIYELVDCVRQQYQSLRGKLSDDNDNRRVIKLDTKHLSFNKDVKGRLQFTLVQLKQMSYKSSITTMKNGRKSKAAFASSITKDNTDNQEAFVKLYITHLIMPFFCVEIKSMIESPYFQEIVDDIYNKSVIYRNQREREVEEQKGQE